MDQQSGSRAEQARARLLSSGRAIFARDGFTKARIKDIAEAADVGIGTYYKYFATKEALFEVIAGELLTEMLANQDSRPIVLRDEDPMDGIERANRRYLASYRENPDLMGIIEEVSTINADVRAVRHARNDAFCRRAAEHLRALQAAGLASRHLDPHSTGVALTSMVSRYAYAWLVHPSDATEGLEFEMSVQTLTLLWGSAIGVDVEDWVRRKLPQDRQVTDSAPVPES